MKIILEKSNTFIGRIGRIIDKYPYTHIALTFDDENYYSFSRRKHHNPFDSGFTIEKINYYAYRLNQEVELKEYELSISEEKKKEIEDFMNQISDYPFDIYGMIKTSLNKPREKDNAYNCMTFIARILEILDIPLMNNPYYKNNIEDLESALISYGLIGKIRIIKCDKEDDYYMSKVSISELIKSFIELNKKLKD